MFVVFSGFVGIAGLEVNILFSLFIVLDRLLNITSQCLSVGGNSFFSWSEDMFGWYFRYYYTSRLVGKSFHVHWWLFHSVDFKASDGRGSTEPIF